MLTPIPTTYYRGGTSKALFFHAHDLPPPSSTLDTLLKRLMGSPEPMQIDGMGGSHIVTSKVAIIAPSPHPDIDVTYTFGQVSVRSDQIDWSGNCGNISAAVGPLAITEGLVKRYREGVRVEKGTATQLVRILVTGTGKVMECHVPVDEFGRVVERGECRIDGVPGTGAGILIDCRETIGGALGKGVLPSGRAVDCVSVQGGEIEYSFCDAGNVVVFARAVDLGVQGDEAPGELDKDRNLLDKIRELRGRVAQQHGMCERWEEIDKHGPLPMVALVSPATNLERHVQSRLFLDIKCHTAMAGTGAVCHAACSRIGGSIVNQMLRSGTADEPALNIQHPCGFMPAAVVCKKTGDGVVPDFETLSFIRTARRMFKGELDVPDDMQHLVGQANRSEPGSSPAQTPALTERLDKAKESPTDSLFTTTEASTVEVKDPGKDATKLLATFTASFRPDQLPDFIIEKLQTLLLDYIGVAAGATVFGESTPAFMSTLNKSAATQSGPCSVFGQGTRFAPATAGLYNAALAHTLDFDDTHVPGSFHPGVTIISAALAQAEAMNRVEPLRFMTALAIGYEVVCRIAQAIGPGGHDRGFHNTSTCGMFGAVATIAVLKGLGADAVENAFGLAVSKASGSMAYLENGSWNKRLHPGFAVADAFLCVSFAESGVIGAAKPIEGKFGLLHTHAEHARPEQLDLPSLGHRWSFMHTGIKPFPACRMTHGQIEMASRFGREAACKKVKTLTIGLSEHCVPIVGARQQNKVHPQTVVDAQFSAYFQTAAAYIHGDTLGWKVYDLVNDAAVSELCTKINVEADIQLHGIQSWMRIEYEDGTIQKDICLFPKGEAANPLTKTDIRNKFDSLAVPVYGKKRAGDALGMVEELEKIDVSSLMALLGSSS